MSQVSLHEPRILILVGPDRSAVQSVELGLREARDSGTEIEAPIAVDVWILVDIDEPAAIRQARTRIESAISTFETDERLHTNIDVLTLGDNGSEGWADEVADAIDNRNFSRIISGTPRVSVERLRERLGVTRIELAPTDGTHRRRRLVYPGSTRRFAVVFGVTYLFYLAVGGFAGGLDLLTGAISAGVVALGLAHVALREEPTLGRTGPRLVRMVVFLPVLLWEVVKANFVIAYIILHPRLPIEPSVDVLQTDTQGGLERMVLANSITLTPGTLTIDVRDDIFTIHSLTPNARTALEEGRLQRLVAWVFRGSSRSTQTTEGSGDS